MDNSHLCSAFIQSAVTRFFAARCLAQRHVHIFFFHLIFMFSLFDCFSSSFGLTLSPVLPSMVSSPKSNSRNVQSQNFAPLLSTQGLVDSVWIFISGWTSPLRCALHYHLCWWVGQLGTFGATRATALSTTITKTSREGNRLWVNAAHPSTWVQEALRVGTKQQWSRSGNSRQAMPSAHL